MNMKLKITDEGTEAHDADGTGDNGAAPPVSHAGGGGGLPASTAIGSASGAPISSDGGAGDTEGGAPEAKPLMSQEQLNERIAQAKRSAVALERAHLKELFGTDDFAEIKKIRDERETLRKEAEKQKRAQMSKEQRLEADLKAAQDRALDLEKRVHRAERDRLYDKQDQAIRRIASAHVNDEYIDDVAFMYARNVLASMDPKAAEKLTEKDISKWFAELAKTKPAFARAGEPRPRVQQRVTTGPKPAPKPAPNPTSVQKTARPGQANSMSKGELRNHLKQRGLQW